MAAANNADLYAVNRIGVFFPGVIPSLEGQCVSLVKYFMADMSDVPNPQAARGDARYVGHTLVAQGHAVEVPYDQRKRGDLVCYEYGLYGHIGVILSGDRTFEENVNWPGVPSKIVDGARVYASRIGNMSEAWRHDMHIYRLNTYKEITDMPRTPIPPEIVSQHYSNFTNGLVSVKPTDAAANGRFEDTVDDEFWYGLIFQVHDLLVSQMSRIPDAVSAWHIAQEYGLVREASDPFFQRAVGMPERDYRASLAPTLKNQIEVMQGEIDNGSGQQYVETKVFTPVVKDK